MRGRLRVGLMRLPGRVGYRIARALHVRPGEMSPANLDAAVAPADQGSHQNGSGGGPLTVELEQGDRSKRLRVRAAGDIWSDEFRDELRRDRAFEASLVWRELAVLVLIAAVLAARTILG